MDSDDRQDRGSTPGHLTRRGFLGASGRFLVYTSPVLTTLLTADRARAMSVDPYFTVEARVPITGTFAGMPAHGSSGVAATRTWLMQPVFGDYAVVSYQQYFITIDGSGANMVTQPIQVKITWSRTSALTADLFQWGPGPITGSTQTVTVPVGGGTLGIGGSIVDSVVDPWPTIWAKNGYTGTVGTVTFTPVGGPYGRLKELTVGVGLEVVPGG